MDEIEARLSRLGLDLPGLEIDERTLRDLLSAMQSRGVSKVSVRDMFGFINHAETQKQEIRGLSEGFANTSLHTKTNTNANGKATASSNRSNSSNINSDNSAGEAKGGFSFNTPGKAYVFGVPSSGSESGSRETPGSGSFGNVPLAFNYSPVAAPAPAVALSSTSTTTSSMSSSSTTTPVASQMEMGENNENNNNNFKVNYNNSAQSKKVSKARRTRTPHLREKGQGQGQEKTSFNLGVNLPVDFTFVNSGNGNTLNTGMKSGPTPAATIHAAVFGQYSQASSTSANTSTGGQSWFWGKPAVSAESATATGTGTGTAGQVGHDRSTKLPFTFGESISAASVSKDDINTSSTTSTNSTAGSGLLFGSSAGKSTLPKSWQGSGSFAFAGSPVGAESPQSAAGMDITEPAAISDNDEDDGEEVIDLTSDNDNFGNNIISSDGESDSLHDEHRRQQHRYDRGDVDSNPDGNISDNDSDSDSDSDLDDADAAMFINAAGLRAEAELERTMNEVLKGIPPVPGTEGSNSDNDNYSDEDEEDENAGDPACSVGAESTGSWHSAQSEEEEVFSEDTIGTSSNYGRSQKDAQEDANVPAPAATGFSSSNGIGGFAASASMFMPPHVPVASSSSSASEAPSVSADASTFGLGNFEQFDIDHFHFGFSDNGEKKNTSQRNRSRDVRNNRSPPNSAKKVAAKTKISPMTSTAEDVPPSWWASGGHGAGTAETSSTRSSIDFEDDNGLGSDIAPPPYTKSSAAASAFSFNMPPPAPAAEAYAPHISVDRAETYRKAGKEYYTANKYDEAVDAYTQALHFAPPTWPTQPIVLGNRAAAFMMSQRFVEAADDCEKALLADSSMVKLHVRHARCMLRLGMFKAVDEICSRVLEMAPPGPTQKVISADQDVNQAKVDARKCLKDVGTARQLSQQMTSCESILDWDSVLKVSETLTELCPQFKMAHTAKVRSLNKLNRWDEAKLCAEELTAGTHVSIQRLTAHPDAKLPAPEPDLVQWNLSLQAGSANRMRSKQTVLKANVHNTVTMVMCMDPDLGNQYITALKNIPASHQCCAEVMQKVAQVLEILTERCNTGPNENGESIAGTQLRRRQWNWVSREHERMQLLLERKELADRCFKSGRFQEATLNYATALKADPSAFRWNAILHSNRAASYMALGMHEDAIRDCNQAINKDCLYLRAFLRRARAYRAMVDFPSCIRDYRRYLSSTPTPVDYDEVNGELNDSLAAQQRKVKEDQQRHTRERAQERENREGMAGGRQSSRNNNNSSANGSRSNSRSNQSYGFFRSYGFDSDDEEESGDRTSYAKTHFKRTGGTGSTSAGSSRYASGPPKGQGADSSANGTRGTSYGRGYQQQYSKHDNSSYSRSSRTGNRYDQNSTTVQEESVPEHYKTLGVHKNATSGEIKKAYHQLALKFHPDKNKEPGAEDVFKGIGLAYAVLSDGTQRSAYDYERRYG